MVIVNTTFVLDNNICQQVLTWINDVYVKSAIHEGAIEDRTLLTRVVTAENEGHTTYALHVWFEDLDMASNWNDRFGLRLRNMLGKKYGERALTFHTYLEVTK